MSKKIRIFKTRLYFKYGDFCKCGCGYLTEINKQGQYRKYYKNHHHRIRIGTKHSPETIQKMKEIKLGESNPMWKDYNSLSYRRIHVRMGDIIKKPEFCQICNTSKPQDLANISGEYKNDINDWQWLCRRCHMISDNRMKNLRQFQNV